MQRLRFIAQRTVASVLAVAVLLLGAPVAQAAPTVVINEVDAVYLGDAPDTVGDAQSSPVMEPGDYGTTLVSQNEQEVVYQGPMFVDTRDADVYKITVLPGVLATFTVTPHNGQDIFVRMYNSDGREVADHHYNAGNRRAAGFAETVKYLKGLHLSREEDGEITVYVFVKLNGGNKAGRYSITYEESNANDATWTTDAADSLLRAPRVGWGQRYEGYLGYGDKADCFQLDVATAIGRKVSIGVKPLDTELDTLLMRSGGRTQASYWTADGNPLYLLTGTLVRIGAREYRREEIVKAATDGGKGFADDQTVYPYYAKAGDSGSDFAYVCVRLKDGAGRYEFSLAHEDAPLVAPAPTDADRAGVTLPPGAPVAPEPPPIRMKKVPATPLVVNIPTPGAGGNGAPPLRSIRIGDSIPQAERDTVKEKKAAETFKKIYRRAPDTKKTADRTAVDTIAYQLKEKKKDIRAEKVAIAKFRATFKRVPKGEADWAIVRAIAYSKVKK